MILPPDENAALFRRDGEWFVPSPLTQGPWDPEHQHGGAVCAALTAALEREASPVPMRTVRICYDLLYPAPMEPLRSRVQVVRSGRRVQLVDVALLQGELAVARASALRIRIDSALGLPEALRGAPAPPLPVRPEELPQLSRPRRFGSDPVYVPGYIRAVDLRRQSQQPRNGEPNVCWSRLRCPVVEGEPTSPLEALGAQVDFVSGMANGLDFTRYVSINPEVTLHVLRPPEGEWIGIEAVTTLSPDGVGYSRGTVHDLRGPIGHASASLYVAPR